MSHAFDPDWCMAPGGTLREWLDASEMTDEVAASRLSLSRTEFEGLLLGDTLIDLELAQRLEGLTVIRAKIWVNLERDYRDGIAAGKSQGRDRFT